MGIAMDDFKINKDFASKYNKYREKEELQKLKSRYGDVSLESDSSDSESEDETAEAITPALERDFLRTLAYLKKKDPVIYDDSKKFYEDPIEEPTSESDEDTAKPKAAKPMYLKDYERKVILENKGKFIEDDSDQENEIKSSSPSYHEEQRKLKEDLKRAFDEEKDEEGVSGLLTKRSKSSHEENLQEKEFRKWLKTPEGRMADGESNDPKMKAVVSEVAPLREYWTDPKLDDGERFLRDYILERKYLDPNAKESIPSYIDIVGQSSDEEIHQSDEESFDKKSAIFEQKYNFRFEEPDEEFIKSYPRTIGTSVRRKEDVRKKKREEQKKKVEEKKRKKQEELKQLKLLKKKEIMDKIKKLQDATGNKDIEFSEKDLQMDFDPEEYDKRMQEIFTNYDGEIDEEKPIFSDLEEDLEDYERYWDEDAGIYYDGSAEPDCEDADFVMDCDYDPAEHQKRKEEKKMKKNKSLHPVLTEKEKKRSPFFDSVSKPKPQFDPDQKSFEKYLDEYYALDYEDIIGDLPCRFKYRQVVPNDFGLSTDEILTATDQELNSWCSLKRAVQYRKRDEEIRDVQMYRKKAKNVWKKARVLKSVYKMPEEEDATLNDKNNDNPVDGVKRKKMNSRKRRRLKERAEMMKILILDDDPVPEPQERVKIEKVENTDRHSVNLEEEKQNNAVASTRLETAAVSSTKVGDSRENLQPKRNTKSSRRRITAYDKASKLSAERLKAYGLQPKKFLKKLQYGNGASS